MLNRKLGVLNWVDFIKARKVIGKVCRQDLHSTDDVLPLHYISQIAGKGY
jgi:hypothetical protein